MLEQFHIKASVFQSLVQRKLMIQEAERQGLVASEEEIRDRIMQIPSFQKNGVFDKATYKQLLEANGYSPAGFERMVGEDIAQQHWQDYFKNRVHVSDAEISQEFTLTQNKRNVKYVLITQEVGQKGVKVDPAEIQKFLADPSKLNIIKGQFEGRKMTTYKGKTFDQVKDSLAHDVLAGSKIDEIQKVNQNLANEILPVLGASASSDAKVNSILKSYGAQVKTTGWLTRASAYIPGVGDASELMKDLFSDHSPLEGGKAKLYKTAAWTMVAVLSESQKPDLAKLPTERGSLIKQIVTRKERDLFETWMKGLTDKAKIDGNPSVVGTTKEA
jgi:hypothetical protein